jgi:hypothetical protein
VILALKDVREAARRRGRRGGETYLPVFGITLEHDGILGFADLVCIVLLDLLHVLLGGNALVFGESTAMTLLLGSVIK